MGRRRTEFDCIAGSQLRDTQGEMLSVEGADISELRRANDNHGKGFFNCLGEIVESKKIFSEADCDNDRHLYYWEKVKSPYIYARGYLYDDEDHPNAKAAAAILRNIHKNDAPLKLKASVEGGVISRGLKDPKLLAQTKIHSVALTFTPANQATLVEPLNLNKSAAEPEDMQLIKSVMHLAQENVPSFRHIVRHGTAQKVHDNLSKIASLVQQMHGKNVSVYIPEPSEILHAAIENKIQKNIIKISNIVRKSTDDPLDKGVKGALTSAALSGALAASPAQADMAKPAAAQVEQQVTHGDVVRSLKATHPHLWALSHVESSGGRNLAHAKIENDESMHHGHRAGGPWGLMPKTVGFAMKVNKDLRDRYPEIASKVANVDDNHKSITRFLNENPKAALHVAKTLYDHLHRSFNGDKDKIAHAWYHGPTGTKRALKRGEDIKSHRYVKKFNDALERHAQQAAPTVQKALLAGYGGAGAPTSLTHGGVIQAESIEGKKKPATTTAKAGFKYIVCSECGHEQIYASNQVKCRECKKSFSLSKLLEFMGG